MLHLQPIILCGGQGTRLWPVSTAKIPKQFISLGDKGTLLEETIRRVNLVLKESEQKGYRTHKPLLIMHKNHSLPSRLSHSDYDIIYEEFANDTAVAVAKAALEVKNRYSNNKVILLVLPADHYIHDVEAFVRDITRGINHVDNSNIVLYGIDPTAPETKYGYIIPSSDGIKFREKPDTSTAMKLINDGALWNSGIFAANVDLVLESFEKTNVLDWVQNPRQGKAQSFDVAVLQEHKNIFALHCSGWCWSDVGTWESFADIPEVKTEMSRQTNVISKDCDNISVLNRGIGNVVMIGCKDLLVVTINGNILIMPNKGDHNNSLKEIATRLS